jgi:ubiquinone/menaquinone biosynthesis C-methylase UbiE
MSINWSVLSNYYSQIAHLYDATRPLPESVSEQIGDRILQIVEAKPETKFLEPGIGTGRIGFPIIQKGYSYAGIDISREMMDELRRKFLEMPKNLTLIQGDASSLPFEDNSFDVVLTTHVLHCLRDPLVGLSEIRRVLKPNGVYLACENLLSSYQKKFWDSFTQILSRYRAKSQPETEAQPEQKFSPFGEEMQRVLKEQGATVETITAARWQQSQSVDELFDAYQSKAFGLCWLVSDTEFQKAIQEFKKWCQHNYESFDVVLSDEATFDITVARNWV